MTNALWEKNYAAVEDISSQGVLISRFVAQSPNECFVMKHTIIVKGTLFSIADDLLKIFNKLGYHGTIRSDDSNFLAIESERALAVVNYDRRYDDISGYEDSPLFGRPQIGQFFIFIAGDRDALHSIIQGIGKTYTESKYAQIKWWSHKTAQLSSYTIFLENPNTKLLQEFYPDMKDPEDYIQRYLDSDSSILLMAGAPGTGKTTMLRHMIYKHNLAASVVYDERIMNDDQLFQNYLFNQREDVLIIEDADTILLSREDDGNKLMSRFLNVSDGLIKLPNKKLIFTTNISDFGKIDPALIRPGRCFDVLHTRPLNLDEAIAAAKAANLPLPFERREYTLAELFNHTTKQREGRRVGFRRGA